MRGGVLPSYLVSSFVFRKAEGEKAMRRFVIVAVSAFAIGACSGSPKSPVQPETVTLPLVASAAPEGVPENHRTHLAGDNEVFTGSPSPADSRAQGQAIIQIAPDGNSFDYKLIASNIVNAVQAHIHCGPAGQNGPIVVWLYPSVTSTGALTGPQPRQDGVLAEGTVIAGMTNHVRPLTAGVNPACPEGIRQGADGFADVLAKIRAGNAYVNVHTNDGVAPTNTGPGDFPGGEIRGQLR